MPAVKPCSFERLDLTEPALAEPSLLYTLRPRGLGTPYVESLSSYVVRLAEAHVVPVWRLILHVRSQVCSERLSRPGMRYAYPANGLGKGVEILRQSFEAATGHGDLRPLTLSALEGSVSKLDIFRTTEAWCPSCLEQWRTEGVSVYSPLLWAVRVVEVCPAHAFPLVGEPLSALPFAVHSSPGRGAARLLLHLFALARDFRCASSQGLPRRATVSSLEFHGCWASSGRDAGFTTDGNPGGSNTESATLFGPVSRCNQEISGKPRGRGGLRIQPLGFRPAQADSGPSVPAELSTRASATRPVHGDTAPVARPRASSGASRFPERHLLGAPGDRTE